MENRVEILAVVGMSGSGKSEVVKVLTEKGWARVYFGGMIYKEMEKRGIAITPESQQEFREKIRAEEGKDWVVRQAILAVYELAKAGQRKIVLDGVYSWTEYRILKHEFPGMMRVVAVVVPRELRYKRVGKREERPFSEEEIKARDYSEIENLEKGGPIAMADEYILNDGTLEELRGKVEKIL